MISYRDRNCPVDLSCKSSSQWLLKAQETPQVWLAVTAMFLEPDQPQDCRAGPASPLLPPCGQTGPNSHDLRTGLMVSKFRALIHLLFYMVAIVMLPSTPCTCKKAQRGVLPHLRSLKKTQYQRWYWLPIDPPQSISQRAESSHFTDKHSKIPGTQLNFSEYSLIVNPLCF